MNCDDAMKRVHIEKFGDVSSDHVTQNEWPRRNIEAWELGKQQI